MVRASPDEAEVGTWWSGEVRGPYHVITAEILLRSKLPWVVHAGEGAQAFLQLASFSHYTHTFSLLMSNCYFVFTDFSQQFIALTGRNLFGLETGYVCDCCIVLTVDCLHLIGFIDIPSRHM